MDSATRDVVLLFGVLFGILLGIRYAVLTVFYRTERDLANEMLNDMRGAWRASNPDTPLWKFLGFENISDYNDWAADPTALQPYMVKKLIHRDF